LENFNAFNFSVENYGMNAKLIPTVTQMINYTFYIPSGLL